MSILPRLFGYSSSRFLPVSAGKQHPPTWPSWRYRSMLRNARRDFGGRHDGHLRFVGDGQ
jgi:hypothetical protein